MFGLFVIEAGSEPRAVLCREGKPLVYNTGAEARYDAGLLGTGLHPATYWEPLKCQPRRLASDAWKARELGRFADGTYTPLPWADLPKSAATADHYAHVSTEDGAKIAYTQDAAKGAGDIQTRVKPGRYLQQFYGDVLSPDVIAKMSAEFSTQYGESLDLQFATTADEIERVYVEGPHSCMAYSADHFGSSVHPCTIYAAGDLAVAYMVRNDAITARALVWPAKKLYGRVYGDEVRLVELLESASYVSGALDGARMLRIEEGNGFVCPYIDGSQSARDDGDYLILGGSGVNGGNQNGLSGSSSICCEACGDTIDADRLGYVGVSGIRQRAMHQHERSDASDNYYYCECCFEARFGYCEHTEETCLIEGMREVTVPGRNGRSNRTQMWGEYAVENDAFRCEGNLGYYHNDLMVTLADGTQWSQEYFEDNGSVCDGKHYAKGDEPQDDADESEVAA